MEATERQSNNINSDNSNSDDDGINSNLNSSNKQSIPFVDYPKYLGNCRVFWYKGLNPRIVIGPQWIWYIITAALISIPYLIVLCLLIARVTLYGTIFGVLIFLFQSISYLLTSIIDPGLPNRELTKFRNTKVILDKYGKLAYCNRCELAIVTGSQSYHCEECNICVEGNMLLS